MASGATRPVTDRPYFNSSSSTVWPPTRQTPASRRMLWPPARISRRTSPGRRAGREEDQVHGGNGAGTHGVDIRDGVGGGDPAEGVGIIHQRGDDIGRLHQGALRRNPVDPGIIRCLRSHKQVCVAMIPKPVQGFRQARRAQFRGSTGGFYQLCQFNHGLFVLFNLLAYDTATGSGCTAREGAGPETYLVWYVERSVTSATPQMGLWRSR